MSAKTRDKLTMVALILAVLFNVNEVLGVLLFTWATVVVLGGFATALNSKDFYIASGILLMVALMVGHKVLNLGRTPKLPNIKVSVGNDAPKAVIDNGPPSSSQSRASKISDAFRDTLYFFGVGSRGKSLADSFLSGYKLVQASICAGLSLWRLLKRDYGIDTANLHKALNIFYGLSLAYALPYLFKRFCTCWMIEIEELFKEMTDKYGLSREKGEEVKFIKNYFFAIYSCCINEGISYGLKMDIVSYTEQLSRDRNYPDRLWAKHLLPKLKSQSNKPEERANKSMNTAMESIQETVVEIPICEDHDHQRHCPYHEHEDNCIIS